VEDNLILSQKAVDNAREYEMATDRLSDAWTGYKMSVGQVLVGPATAILNHINALTQAEKQATEEGLLPNSVAWGKRKMVLLEAIKAEQEATDAAMLGKEALDQNTVSAEENAAAMKLINDQNKELIGLIGSLQNIESSFGEQYKTIAADMTLTDEERKVKLAELAAEHDLNTKKIILNLLEQKLAQDGLTTAELDFLLQKGEAWGIYSAEVVTEARLAINEVNFLAESVNSIPNNKTITITTIMNTVAATTLGGLQNRPGFRAAGGPVSAGSMYMVGEKGPEMFVPGQSGRIVPNGGGGNVNVYLTVASPMTIMDEQTVKKTLLPFIIDGVRQAQAKGAI
jgi:hypothetical protein